MDVANLIGKVIKIIPKFSLMKNVIFAPQVFIPILVTIILLGIVCFLYDKKTKEWVNMQKKKRLFY